MTTVRSSERRIPVALSIAALDPSGGAGIAADLRTFASEGIWGCAVLTAITYQSTAEIAGWEPVEAGVVTGQLSCLLSDVSIDAAKIGMIGSAAACRAIADSARAEQLAGVPIVLDPVLWSSRGESLGDPSLPDAMVDQLFPLVSLVTPNIDEAGLITGSLPERVDDMAAAARSIAALGPGAVLVTGGHGEGSSVVDVLWYDGQIFQFEDSRIETANTHGTGCVLSSAIAAGLARGMSVPKAVEAGRSRVRRALKSSLGIGLGSGPIDPIAD